MNPEVHCDYLTFAISRLRPPSGQGQQIPQPENEGSRKGELGPGRKLRKPRRKYLQVISLSLSLSLSQKSGAKAEEGRKGKDGH